MQIVLLSHTFNQCDFFCLNQHIIRGAVNKYVLCTTDKNQLNF